MNIPPKILPHSNPPIAPTGLKEKLIHQESATVGEPQNKRDVPTSPHKVHSNIFQRANVIKV